ncbi:exodeoxyribonuclease V subunit gamma [Buchnera aphidicola (Ceratoglyphina bambusae)]|uniref:exodeoxyribonuclease V subunit gamma n=1 Tax=Buchnera aphidicola TaxID=9 RepID=UPI0031B82E63
MLKMYTSNNIKVLMKKICNIIKKKPLKSIFNKEIFIVQNYKISQWIKHFILKNTGICANIKFYTAENFFWKIIKKYKYKYKNPELFWKIFSFCNKNNIKNNFVKKNSSQNKKILFSIKISEIFQEYLLHNPKIILNWEKDITNIKEESFQKEIWKFIKKKTQKKMILQIY